MTEPSPSLESETAPKAEETPPAPLIGPVSATILGFFVVALVSGATVQVRSVAPLAFRMRALVVFFTVGHVLSLGAAATLVVALFTRFGPKKFWFGLAALALAAAVFGVVLLDSDAAGLAERASEITRLPFSLALVAISIALAMVIPAAFAVGRALARRWVRLVVPAAAALAVVVNGNVLLATYEGVHLVVALAAGVLVAAALAGARLPRSFGKTATWIARGFGAAAIAWGVVSVLLIPAESLRVLLLAQPAAVLAPFPLRAGDDVGDDWEPSAAERPWFQSREDLAPIPPSEPRLLPPEPIVLLLSIDSLRADVLADESRRTKLPGLFTLRDESAYFTEARSAGSSTAPALAAVFSCVHYSQQYWSTHPKDPSDPFPYLDPKPRFPELLAAAGVATLTVDSAGWLLDQFGVVRGFQKEESMRSGRLYPSAHEVLGALTDRIREHEKGPLFAFAHLLDAHSPYDRALRSGPLFERYIAELTMVDIEIRRLRSELVRTGRWGRTTIVIMSDHGEAFLEHGMTFHGQTLYDELLRVPLLIRAPGQSPRRIEQSVSLVDLGPTILDFYGQPTPGRCMGQSLAPLVAGQNVTLTRPIVAEARLKRAMVTPDGMKIIHDSRAHSVELYDLKNDPREEKNLYDEDSPEAVAKLSMVKRFFAAHTFRKPGYKVPFRRW